jgi:hypothetical protein
MEVRSKNHQGKVLVLEGMSQNIILNMMDILNLVQARDKEFAMKNNLN